MRFLLKAVMIPLLCLTTSAGSTVAATLCGTVTDARTDAHVQGAAVLAFHAGGGYAGYVAVTDVAGAFCMPSIPPGLYDLQIRVDDYLERIVTDVLVEDAVSGVSVELGGRLRMAPPSPNPARESVLLRFELAALSATSLQVFDVAGRLVQAWRTDDLPAGSHLVTWSFRDLHGNTVRPGTYFVRLSAAGTQVVRRLVFLGS